MIAFVSSIIGQVTYRDYPKYSWFVLLLTLALNIIVIVIVASNAIQTYHVAIVGYAAAALVTTTSLTNSLVHTNASSKIAAGVGFVLLTMTQVCF